MQIYFNIFYSILLKFVCIVVVLFVKLAAFSQLESLESDNDQEMYAPYSMANEYVSNLEKNPLSVRRHIENKGFHR